MVIYANGSCSRSVTFITGLIGIFAGLFLGAIKYIKEWLANIVVILKT